MRLEDFVAATALLGVASGAVIEKKEAATSNFSLKTDQLAAQAMGNLAQFVQVNGYFSDGCTLENISFRREWYVFSR